MSSDKRRWPWAEAIPIVRELLREIQPACEELIIAGSLRRKKETVGDIEILFIPKTAERPGDLFSSSVVSLVDEVLEELLANGMIAKRETKAGRITWGYNNKLAVHVASGIPVDFFTACYSNWFNYLVCRTGPSESNIRIAEAAKAKGYRWNPYREGFTELATGKSIRMGSEAEVFEFVGLPFLPPHERK